MAAALIENATVREIEQELHVLGVAAAQPDQPTTLHTRVLTHTAWVPAAWQPAAKAVLDGLGERHPSRTILLVPDPGSDRDALDAEVDLRCFAGAGPEQAVCTEVITIWLRGRRAAAPASVVQPLLVADLPAFLRWRGSLPFGEPELEQLLGVADRFVVDSREWEEPEAGYRSLPELFGLVAVSDIAWARLLHWRLTLADRWPGIADAESLRVRGPRAEAILLARWLETRIGRPFRLEHEPAPEIERVEVDGEPVRPEREERRSPSDLLSDQLEIDTRDRVYEAAVAAGTG